VEQPLSLVERPIDSPGPGRFWGDQWLRVSEKLLKGLNHQFTNRLTALGALLDMMQPGLTDEGALVEGFSDELNRLGRLLRLYRSLSTDGLTPPEATRLQDVLPTALSLHEHHPDLKYMKCELAGDVDTSPILVRQASLLRATLVLLESVAGNAHRADRARQMVVTYGNADGVVWVRFEGDAPPDQRLFSGEGTLLHTVRNELAHASGTADGTIRRTGPDVRIEYEIRLPTLASARRLLADTA
jgi:hypothetical protein